VRGAFRIELQVVPDALQRAQPILPLHRQSSQFLERRNRGRSAGNLPKNKASARMALQGKSARTRWALTYDNGTPKINTQFSRVLDVIAASEVNSQRNVPAPPSIPIRGIGPKSGRTLEF